jgi:hypothetical protein
MVYSCIKISDPKEEKDDEVIEDLISTHCDSIEENAQPLVLEEVMVRRYACMKTRVW